MLQSYIMKTYFQVYDYRAPTEQMRYPYRRGRAKKPDSKRIEKYADTKLMHFSVFPSYFVIPFWYTTLLPLVRLLHHVIWDFFMPQYLRKIHLRRTPIQHVDHLLDEKVPFAPEHVGCYMDFINMWIRPLTMLLKRFGIAQGSKLCAEWLRYITLTYREAFAMYKICMTTTYRPKPTTQQIKRLYSVDPHYMCVPSLHIAIVNLCHAFYRMIFEREEFTEKEIEKWQNELFNHAVEIGETVLYLKQHSVNCIPAALYMMTRITPELFTPQDAIIFIDSLFKDAPDVSPEDKTKINSHIRFIYERFLLEGALEDDWKEPVLRWLKDYTPHTPAYADI